MQTEGPPLSERVSLGPPRSATGLSSNAMELQLAVGDSRSLLDKSLVDPHPCAIKNRVADAQQDSFIL